jgi:hypothetical protein
MKRLDFLYGKSLVVEQSLDRRKQGNVAWTIESATTGTFHGAQEGEFCFPET